MPVTGKPFQPRELAELCHNGGFRDEDLIMAVAVCLSESGGYPRAWNDNHKLITDTKAGDIVANIELYYHFTILNPATGKVRLDNGEIETYPVTVEVITSRDVGLFQINIPARDMGTDREDALYDVVANVATARQYWQTRGWQPWYGWVNGYATATE